MFSFEMVPVMASPTCPSLGGVLVHALAEGGYEAQLELVVWHLDRRREARVQAARHALVERRLGTELRGRAVGSKHDLLARTGEVVKGVEEEVDGACLSGELLDVVDDEDVDVVVVVAQDVRRGPLAVRHGRGVVGDEGRAVLVDADTRGVVRRYVVLDCPQEVRLAKAALAVDEERVVRAVLAVCHLEGRLVGERVLVAHDEAVERELGVHLGDVVHQGVSGASLVTRCLSGGVLVEP